MSADIKTYLDSQGLSEAMTAAVKQVITERPANGLTRLAELLAAAGEAKEGPDAGTLVYFGGLKSRGEPTQICAAASGVKLTMQFISVEEWGTMKSETMPMLPALKQPDGKVMVETEDLMKHFATMGGKLVIDAKQAELAKIGNASPFHLHDPLWNLPPPMQEQFGIPPYETWLEAAVPILKDLAVKLGDGPYFGGEKPGYGECYTWHNLDVSLALAEKEFTAAVGEADMGKLKAWHAKFAQFPGVKEYLERRPKVWGFPGSKAQPA